MPRVSPHPNTNTDTNADLETILDGTDRADERASPNIPNSTDRNYQCALT
jgi:hypothetical protein